MSYLNLCRSCGKDFASVKAFDKHRVGRHEPMERRCLTTEAMERAGCGRARTFFPSGELAMWGIFAILLYVLIQGHW